MLDLVTGSFGQMATEMELIKPGATPQNADLKSW